MRMPVEQTFPGQWLAELLRRVQHHLNDTIDISIFVGFESSDVQPQLTSEGGTNILWIKHDTFDCARFDRFFRKHL